MFTLCRYKIDIFLRIFLMNPKICYLESMFRARLPSIFHHICHKMPRVPCNLHVVTTWHSPDHAIRKKHATRHDWSACLEKWNSFVKNLAKVSRLSHTIFDMSWNMLECHQVPRFPHETTLRDVWTSKGDHFCSTPHWTRCHLDGCDWLRTQKQRRANTSQPQGMHSGKSVREKKVYGNWNIGKRWGK